MCETDPLLGPMADAAVAWRETIPTPPSGLSDEEAARWREAWFTEHPPPPPAGSTEDEAARWGELWYLTHPPAAMDEQQLCGWRAAHTRRDPTRPIIYANVGAFGQARSGGAAQKIRAQMPTGVIKQPQPSVSVMVPAIEKKMVSYRRDVGEKMTEDQVVDWCFDQFGAKPTLARAAFAKVRKELKRASKDNS